MPRQKKLLCVVSAALIVLLSACSFSTGDTRLTDIQDPIVQVVIGNDLTYGSGIVVAVEPGEGEQHISYILTARHVIELARVTNQSIMVRWWVRGVPIERAAIVWKYTESPGDLAILRVQAEAPAVAWTWDDENLPDQLSELYIGGIGAMQIPLLTKGELSLYIKNGFLTSAHANPGYSGSGAFVYHNGHWRLVGVVQAIGSQHGDLLYHVSMAISWDIVSKWFSDIGFAKIKK